jgi:hypothetical protein
VLSLLRSGHQALLRRRQQWRQWQQQLVRDQVMWVMTLLRLLQPMVLSLPLI